MRSNQSDIGKQNGTILQGKIAVLARSQHAHSMLTNAHSMLTNAHRPFKHMSNGQKSTDASRAVLACSYMVLEQS